MADSSLMPALVGLAGTIIGSGIVLSTQFILEGKKQAAEKKRRRAEKLQELVAALYEHHHWLGRITRDLGNVDIEVPAYTRMMGIQTVYFPELHPYLVKYAEASSSIIEAAKTPPVSHNVELINSYRECFKSVWGKLDRYAQREEFH